MKAESPKYNAQIVAGSLLIKESRLVADLLITGVDDDRFYEKLLEDNILQKRSPASTIRQGKLIKNRLSLMGEDFWKLVRDGSHDVSTQALFCTAIKHSRLLGDFIVTTIRTHRQTFKRSLTQRDWDTFFEHCAEVDPSLKEWSESTAKKVRQVIFRILAEAKVIDSTRSKNLLPFSVLLEIGAYLENNKEQYVLTCLEALT